MDIHSRINTFAKLGEAILDPKTLPEARNFWDTLKVAQHRNPWFTPEFCENAITSIATSWLNTKQLEEWILQYPTNAFEPPIQKTVGVVMAGNVPFVGFHDLLSVLLAGHKLICKVSSKDAGLTQALVNLLTAIEPKLNNVIAISENKLENFDAVIATGSNNTSRYFEYYFGKYPNIIRKNRHSIAIISGNETQQQLQALASDIFMYFGLGCRNVSKLLVPKNYDFSALLASFENFKHLANHNKYANNYEYHRAIYLMNKIEHIDTGYSILKPDESLGSPVGVLFYQYYTDIENVVSYIDTNSHQLQCVVANLPEVPGAITFGQAQNPRLTDYADGIDTIEFLSTL